MALDSLRPKVKGIMQPCANAAIKIGLSPNTCTIIAFICAIMAGVLFYYNMLAMAVFFVAMNSVFDALDGAVARELKVDSLKGDFLDHVTDRYADIFIVCGIFAGGVVPWQIGVLALTGVLMSSYLGTQAQAVGVERDYGGILGRADRLALIMGGGIVAVIYPGNIYGLTVLGWVLFMFGVLGHITAIQRFANTWRQIVE